MLASKCDSNNRAIGPKVKILASAVMAARAPTTVSNDSLRPQRKAAPRMAKTKYKKNGLLGPLVIRLITVGQSRSVACTRPECRNCDFFRNQSVPIKAKEWAQYNNSKASIRLGY